MTNYQKYKLIILASLGLLSLIIINNFSSNDRYEMDVDFEVILDKKKGTIYNYHKETKKELNTFINEK